MSDVNENDKSQEGQDDSFPSISSAPSAKELGGQIGPYKLLSVLGEGGFGMVYLAEQTRPIKRRVALKVIKPGMDTKQVIARFESERQALALLDHPNIAHVFDAGTTEAGRPYFAMELVKGLPITEHCDQHKLGIEERLELFRQVCDAVQHAHQKGIIHRDLKPSNILVPVRGGKPIPMIIDFGVAKAISQPLTERTLFTEQGQFLGTPEYMSPEQAGITIEDVDTRSDIYSLGVVLYELLTGTLPFSREELKQAGFAEIQRIIREVDPQRPSTRLSSLGEKAKKIAERRCTEVGTLTKRMYKELEWIPLKAMRKEPDRRYQTASELGQDIRNYLKGDPLLAGPESASYRLKKAIKRNRALVTGVAAVLAVLLVGIVISTIFALKSLQAEKAEQGQRVVAEQAKQVAEKQKEVAEFALKETEQAKNIAENEKARAESALKEVEARSKELQVASYYNNIRLADKELADGSVYRASRLLESCPSDLLGWEWYYLLHVLRSAGATYWINDISSTESSIGSNDLIALCDDGGRVIIWDVGKASQTAILRGHTGRPTSVAFSPDGSRVVSGSDNGIIKVWDLATGSCISTVTVSDEVSQLISDMSLFSERNLKIPEEMQPCAENFKKIYAAINRYKKDKGKLPDWLSDLVPDYLSNEVLFCPNDPEHQAERSPDPKLPCSYSYQFSPARNARGEIYREVKERQVKEFGDIVPIVRCDTHDSTNVLNLSVGGQVYWSVLYWERMFQSTPRPVPAQPSSPGIAPRIAEPATPESAGFVIPPENLEIPAEMQTCAVGLQKIHVAIKAHEKDKGDLPNWLSDLIPNYLSKEALLCPTHPDQTQAQYYPDPNLPCIYEYEFQPIRNRISGSRLLRDWKKQQVRELGDVVPIVRCFHHGSVALNISAGGQTYWSPMLWETVFGSAGASSVAGTSLDTTTSRVSIRQRMAKMIRSVAVSPDGRRVISANSDGEAFLWDALTGKALTRLSEEVNSLDRINSVTYRPDGKRILTLGRYLELWDANGVEQVVKQIYCSTATFSVDSRLLAYFTGESLHLCDSTTGEELRVFPTQFEPDTAAFSPDNKYIVAGATHGRIKVWDTSSGREELAIQAHAGGIESVAFSKNTNKIISVDEDGTIGVLEFPERNTGQPTIIGDTVQSARAMAFSPDCKRVAVSVAPGNNLKILNTVDGSEIKTLNTNVAFQPVLVISPTGNLLACSARPTSRSKSILSEAIDVWDLETGVRAPSLDYADHIIAIAFDPNDKLIASVHRRGCDVWDLSKRTKIRAFSLGLSYMSSGAVAFNPKGGYVCASGGFTTNVIAMWDLATGDEVWKKETENPMLSIAFSPDGKYIASGDEAGMLEIWDANTGDKRARCYHGGEINSVDFSLDGTRILSGSSDGLVKIWDTRSEVEILTLQVEGVVEAVALSPDGKSILAGCDDGKIRLWDSGSDNKATIASYFKERGLDHDQNGNYDQAIQAFSRAVQIEPKNPQNSYQRGLAYNKQKQYENAIADFSATIELDGNNPRYWFDRGGSYYRTGKYDLCISDNAKAVEIDPQNELWLNGLARLYATCPIDKFRNGQKAVELATRACELTEWSDPYNIDTLAAAYAEARDFKLAVQWQERANTLFAERSPTGRLPSSYETRLTLYQSGQPFYDTDTSLFSELNLKIPEKMQPCAENFKKIYPAIKQYEKDKGKLPDWLSALVPNYLSNEILFCPNDPKHRAEYYPDPNLPCSYSWQFSTSPVPTGWDPTGKTLCRDWKTHQVKIFGDIVPMVRCGHHGSQCLNLAFGGKIWWSPVTWEYMIKPDYRFSPDELRRDD